MPLSQTVRTPGEIALRAPGSMARTGHAFGGWRDSMGRIFPTGHIMRWTGVSGGTITLDAHWIPNVITINYNGGGHTSGSVPASQTVSTPGTISLRQPGSMIRTGHTLLAGETTET